MKNYYEDTSKFVKSYVNYYTINSVESSVLYSFRSIATKPPKRLGNDMPYVYDESII